MNIDVVRAHDRPPTPPAQEPPPPPIVPEPPAEPVEDPPAPDETDPVREPPMERPPISAVAAARLQRTALGSRRGAGAHVIAA